MLAVPAVSQKESAPKFYVEAVPTESQKEFFLKIMWRQFPPNLKKNFPPNSVESVPAESQKESTPKICGGSSCRISKRIHPKSLEEVPTKYQKTTCKGQNPGGHLSSEAVNYLQRSESNMTPQQ